MDHCALMVNDLDWYMDFFSSVFGFSYVKESVNEYGFRQVWITGGLQLVSTDRDICTEDGLLNHLAFTVDDVDACVEKSYSFGAVSLEKGKNWIMLPTGLCLEILQA